MQPGQKFLEGETYPATPEILAAVAPKPENRPYTAAFFRLVQDLTQRRGSIYIPEGHGGRQLIYTGYAKRGDEFPQLQFVTSWQLFFAQEPKVDPDTQRVMLADDLAKNGQKDGQAGTLQLLVAEGPAPTDRVKRVLGWTFMEGFGPTSIHFDLGDPRPASDYHFHGEDFTENYRGRLPVWRARGDDRFVLKVLNKAKRLHLVPTPY